METVSADVGRPRTLAENQVWLRGRLEARLHPLDTCDPAGALAVIDALPGLDGESWGSAWAAAGARAEAAGDWVNAHAYYFIGRFPTPNHPAKLACAVKERAMYLKVAEQKNWDLRRVVVPFAGRADEGHEIALYYRRPPGIAKPPVVALWGGIDAWKEQLTAQVQTFLDAGIATIALDNPGTGESPVVASPDAERMFVPIFDWACAQADLDGERIGVFGRSFGGYWATKLAHVMPDRIAGAVSWAGGAHHMFQRDWIEASRYPDSYLMDLAEARGRMLGAGDDTGYIEGFAALSLLDQGILEKPCAPLLLCNGKYDKQCPVQDIYLLLDHGSPKSVRFFPGGHMGHGPDTVPTMVRWLKQQLASGRT
jgi:esterase FrsA